MITMSSNIHHVVSIKLRVVDFGDFVSNELTFETDDGSTYTVSAFAKERLAIEGGDVTQRAGAESYGMETTA